MPIASTEGRVSNSVEGYRGIRHLYNALQGKTVQDNPVHLVACPRVRSVVLQEGGGEGGKLGSELCLNVGLYVHALPLSYWSCSAHSHWCY